MSEAFARMHLRDFVRQDDVDRAISATIKSFISSQKWSVKRQMERVSDFCFLRWRPGVAKRTHAIWSGHVLLPCAGFDCERLATAAFLLINPVLLCPPRAWQA